MFPTTKVRSGKVDASPEGEPTDRDLLLAFRQGEAHALERLIHRHAALVHRVCWGVLGHASDAEDAFEATFLVLARKAHSLGARESVAGWLFQSVLGVAPAAIALAQGFLKVLGWEKMKTTALTLASLLVFGGIALAALKDNPTRFEKGLCGRVVAYQPGKTPTVTIELGDTGALLNLDIAAQAKIWTAYEQGALEDLQPGQEVSLRLASDHRTVAEIHLRGIVREVRVKSLGSDGKITVVDEDDDGPAAQPVELPLAPDAIFRLGGLPAAKSDWKPGMTVPLELGRDGKTVHAIEAEAPADSMFEGLLADWIGTDQLKIATEDDDDRPGETRVFAINGDTLFQRDGNKSTRLEIKKGSRLVLRLDQDKKTVRAVQATSPEPPETPDPEASKKN